MTRNPPRSAPRTLAANALEFTKHFLHGLVVVVGVGTLIAGGSLFARKGFSLQAVRDTLQPKPVVIVRHVPIEASVPASLVADVVSVRALAQAMADRAAFLQAAIAEDHTVAAGPANRAVRQGLEGVTAHVGAAPAAAVEGDGATVPTGMHPVVADIAQRYRVTTDSVASTVAEASRVGYRLGLDPFVIVAVVAVESGFNPQARSVAGAQGLMQVIPRFHRDKLRQVATHSSEASFFHPKANIRVGSAILKEAVERTGSLTKGLQWYAGEANDPSQEYAGKVLAESRRLKSIVRHRGPDRA